MTAVQLPAPVLGSLSPSRAGDFMTCPLLYRFRVIDRLPERSSPEAVRGTVVHAVLERLFDLPPEERTPSAAAALVQPAWDQLVDADPDLAGVFHDEDAEAGSVAGEGWLASAREILEGYFVLEDPRRLRPAERESLVEAVLASGLRLRGFVDRLDIAPGGEVRVVDYKTGRMPGERHEGKALFQLKFYALIVWRTRGVVPRELRLLYLRERDMLRYSPTESELMAMERLLGALWQAIERASSAGDFRARRSALCHWCGHQALCPEFGGTPPPLPPPRACAEVEVGMSGSAAVSHPTPQRLP